MQIMHSEEKLRKKIANKAKKSQEETSIIDP